MDMLYRGFDHTKEGRGTGVVNWDCTFKADGRGLNTSGICI